MTHCYLYQTQFLFQLGISYCILPIPFYTSDVLPLPSLSIPKFTIYHTAFCTTVNEFQSSPIFLSISSLSMLSPSSFSCFLRIQQNIRNGVEGFFGCFGCLGFANILLCFLLIIFDGGLGAEIESSKY